MTPRRLALAWLAAAFVTAAAYPHLRGSALLSWYAVLRLGASLLTLVYLTARYSQGWRPRGAQWAALVLAAGAGAQATVGPWAWPWLAVERWDVGRALSIATYAGVIVALAMVRNRRGRDRVSVEVA